MQLQTSLPTQNPFLDPNNLINDKPMIMCTMTITLWVFAEKNLVWLYINPTNIPSL